MSSGTSLFSEQLFPEVQNTFAGRKDPECSEVEVGPACRDESTNVADVIWGATYAKEGELADDDVLGRCQPDRAGLHFQPATSGKRPAVKPSPAK